MISTFWLSQFILAAGAASTTATSAGLEPTQAGATRAQLVFGDFNGDGLDDAVAQRPGGSFEVLENRGVAGFANVTRKSGLGGVAFASCVLVEDFDGDGTADLFLGSASQRLWRGLGDGTFAPFEADLTHGEVDFVASSRDMDSDGQPDLQLGTENGTLLYRNIGGGLFETVSLPLAPGLAAGAAPQAWSTLPGSPAVSADGAGQSSSSAASSEARRTRWMNARAGAGFAGGGASSASGGGSTVTGVGTAAQAGAASSICAGTIEDQAGGPCLEASSVPALGSLYPMSTRLNVSAAGNVGIGASNSDADLLIGGVGNVAGRRLLGFGAGDVSGLFFESGFNRPFPDNYVSLSTFASSDVMTWTEGGRVGIGTDSPGVNGLHIKKGTNPRVRVEGFQPSIEVMDTDSGVGRRYQIASFNGELNIRDTSAGFVERLKIRADGTVSVAESLEIRGGADIVERFNASEEVEPGTVMVIDPTSPGELMPSAGAYDTKVAGVVSGAGGVNPGLCLSQDGTLDGETLVAMNGRVYVKATAAGGAIQPGDRLTTSDIAGHAMKATNDAKAPGTVIGKAMSGLKSGEGLVLVLVNLQ
jgi:hypothetical protein